MAELHGLQRALFQVLYNYRRRRHDRVHGAPSEVAEGACTRVAPALVEASQEDLDAGATCRFCFEAGPKRLIAPCSCSGSQRWVHKACLVRWQQVSGASGRPRRSAACNVCNTTYALAPPPAPPTPTPRAGMLLVATANLAGSFDRSIILLCEVNASGAHGVIINRRVLDPAAGHSPPVVQVLDGHPIAAVADASGRATNQSAAVGEATAGAEAAAGDAQGGRSVQSRGVRVEWRRGGPVCGGRLGVVRYTVLHTLGSAAAAEVPSLEVIAGGSGVVAADPSLSVVAEPVLSAGYRGGRALSPAASSDRALVSLIGNLASSAGGGMGDSGDGGDGGGGIATGSGASGGGGGDNTPPVRMPRAMIFIGHCKWGRGQLQHELARGSWTLCAARAADVLEADEGSWDQLQASGRLGDGGRPIEDDGDDDEEDDDEDDEDEDEDDDDDEDDVEEVSEPHRVPGDDDLRPRGTRVHTSPAVLEPMVDMTPRRILDDDGDGEAPSDVNTIRM